MTESTRKQFACLRMFLRPQFAWLRIFSGPRDKLFEKRCLGQIVWKALPARFLLKSCSLTHFLRSGPLKTRQHATHENGAHSNAIQQNATHQNARLRMTSGNYVKTRALDCLCTHCTKTARGKATKPTEILTGASANAYPRSSWSRKKPSHRLD